MVKRVFKQVVIFGLSIILASHSAVVVAVSDEQRKIFNYSISYFNTEAGGNSCSSGSVLSGDNKDYEGNPVWTDDQLAKVAELQPFYEAAAQKYNIPWQLLAVVHLRETGLYKGGTAGQGPFQDYEGRGSWPDGPYDDALFQKAADKAASDLVAKAGGRDLHDDNNVKYMFFAYNGAAKVYKQQALNLGYSQEEADRGEGSPYVMNKADAQRDPNKNPTGWGQIKTDGGGISYPANQDYGAFVYYAALGGSNGGGSGCGSSAPNGSIAEVATEMGKWGEQYQACYVYGGGHGWDKTKMDEAIANHFTGNYGVDCSAFVGAVIYKATGNLIIEATTEMCNDKTNFQEVTDPQPGDLSINCDSHVEVITQVNGDGSYATVGSHRTGCGAGYGASPGQFKGEKILRYIGPGASSGGSK